MTYMLLFSEFAYYPEGYSTLGQYHCETNADLIINAGKRDLYFIIQ